jgi:Kazal-type serine protease inhibitor domain
MTIPINKTILWIVLQVLLVVVQQQNHGNYCSGAEVEPIIGGAHVPQEDDLFGASSPSYDCSVGCHFDGRIVCGEDDITYPNECFAMCQVRVFASFLLVDKNY